MFFRLRLAPRNGVDAGRVDNKSQQAHHGAALLNSSGIRCGRGNAPGCGERARRSPSGVASFFFFTQLYRLHATSAASRFRKKTGLLRP